MATMLRINVPVLLVFLAIAATSAKDRATSTLRAHIVCVHCSRHNLNETFLYTGAKVRVECNKGSNIWEGKQEDSDKNFAINLKGAYDNDDDCVVVVNMPNNKDCTVASTRPSTISAHSPYSRLMCHVPENSDDFLDSKFILPPPHPVFVIMFPHPFPLLPFKPKI